MEDVLAIVLIFGTLPFIIGIVTYFRNKRYQANVGLMSAMIAKGDTLTPEVIRTLGVTPRDRFEDLRKGLILIAVAIAALLASGAISDIDGQKAVAALAMFPLFIGIVYTGLWVFIGRKQPVP